MGATRPITSYQLAALVLMGTTVKGFYRLGETAFAPVGHNAWLVVVVSALPIAVGLWAIMRLTAGRVTVVDAVTVRGVPSVVAVCLFVYSTLSLAHLNKQAVAIIRLTLLAQTPINWIALAIMLLTLYGAWIGPQRQLRAVEVTLITGGLSMALLWLTPLQYINMDLLKPWLEVQELGGFFGAIPAAMMIYHPVVMLLMVPAEHDRKGRRLLYGALALAVIWNLYFVLVAIAKLGVFALARLNYPLITLMDTVRLENFIVERLLFLFILVWMLLKFVPTAITLYVAGTALTRLCGRKEATLGWFLIPGAAAFVIPMFLSGDQYLSLLQVVLGYFVLGLGVALPLVLLLLPRRKTT